MSTKLRKALTSQPGSGSGLLEIKVAREIIPLIRQQSYMRQFFRVIDMPSPTFRVPKVTIGHGVYGVEEGAIAPTYNSAIGQIELVAKKLMTQLPVTAEIEEDSILPLIPLLKEDLAAAFALAEEDAFLNGDPTKYLPATGDPKSLFKGLRSLAAAPPVDMGGASLTDDNGLEALSQAVANLGVYGKVKSDLICLVPLREEARIRTWKGFLTIQAYAQMDPSTLIVGEIGRIFGVPVVPTTLLPTNLSATIGGDTVENLSEIVIAHKKSVYLGDRRKFQIKSSEHVLMTSDQFLLVPSERVAMASAYPDAIVKVTNIGSSIPSGNGGGDGGGEPEE